MTETTITAIRYYQKNGLITPELVDSTTGYRYFNYKDIIKIKTISYLRKMDFSIKDIMDILEMPIKDILDIFEANILKIEREVELLENKKEIIKNLKRVYQDQLHTIEKNEIIKCEEIKVNLEKFKYIDIDILNQITNKYREDVKSVGIIKNEDMESVFVELYSGLNNYTVAGGEYKTFKVKEDEFINYIENKKEYLVFIKYKTVFNWEYEIREKTAKD